MQNRTDAPWLIVKIHNQLFAIASDAVRQMVMLPEVEAVPDVPAYVRGVVNIRGQVMPLVDLRRRLGIISAAAEVEAFCELLDARENDHRKWLDELRRSVEENREFGLTTDPHQCAFGKWYDKYRAADPWIAGQLRKLEAPHQKIHGLGIEIRKLMAEGNHQAAECIIQGQGEETLGAMIRLFGELRGMVQQKLKETVAILDLANQSIAVTVDAAAAVEKLAIEDLPEHLIAARGGMVRRLGKRAKGEELVLILEPDRILETQDLGGRPVG